VVLGRIVSAIGVIFGATALGVGTIFQPKARLDDHWSTSPKVLMVSEIRSASSGGPFAPEG
jgi:hypothetical protein